MLKFINDKILIYKKKKHKIQNTNTIIFGSHKAIKDQISKFKISNSQVLNVK